MTEVEAVSATLPEADFGRVGVDIGGTFTDVALEYVGQRYTTKVLTTHRAPEEAVLDGLGQVLKRAGCAARSIGLIIHGTTLATNALIERKGAKTALLTTAGFRDVIEMGTESRFEQYDLNIVKPTPLVPRRYRFPVPERMSARGDVLLPLDASAIDAIVPQLERENIESVAIGFIHSFVNPDHEHQVAERLLAKLPTVHVSVSSEVSPEIREYERFSTTCANAYLQPLVANYLERLEEVLVGEGFTCPLFLMLSSGGIALPEAAKRFPVRLIESGPAGGAVLAAHVARTCELDSVLSFDMGGTTAKICLIDNAKPQTARAFEVARAYRFKPGSGLPIRIPVVEMVEIGAGGGSIAAVDTLDRITVGPQSAGSDPGPACYDRGGDQPTVTDADLLVGNIAPAAFAGASMQLSTDSAKQSIADNIAAPFGHVVEYSAHAILEVVDENMANAAREHAAESGKSLHARTIVAFGGSAPLHAARLADKLHIDQIVVPSSAGVGSAVGFLRAPVAYELSRSVYQRLSVFEPAAINEMLEGMAREASQVVAAAAPGANIVESRLAYMRYVGQGHEIPVSVATGVLGGRDGKVLRQSFDEAYQRLYGRSIDGVDVEVVNWTLTSIAASDESHIAPTQPPEYRPQACADRQVFKSDSAEFVQYPVYRRETLQPGARIHGPALIDEDETTTVLPSAYTANLNSFGDIVMRRSSSSGAD